MNEKITAKYRKIAAELTISVIICYRIKFGDSSRCLLMAFLGQCKYTLEVDSMISLAPLLYPIFIRKLFIFKIFSPIYNSYTFYINPIFYSLTEQIILNSMCPKKVEIHVRR